MASSSIHATVASSSSENWPFAQSRMLSYAVDGAWIDALFDYLQRNPRNALYSMAFALSFIPTFELTERTLNRPNSSEFAAFAAARELYDLTDDLLRDTDSLTYAELARSRAFRAADFARATDCYTRSLERVSAIIREHETLLRPSLDRDVTNTSSSSSARDKVRVDTLIEIRRVFELINATTPLPLPVNRRNTLTIPSFDLRGLNEAIGDGATADNVPGVEVRYTPILRRRIFDEGEHRHTSDASATTNVYARPFTILEAYLVYAPVLYRYESFADIIAAIRGGNNDSKGNIDGNIENSGESFVAIEPLYLPARSVWQSGTSQLLWIVLHTLAALVVCRGHLYVNRLMVLLSNTSFFVWCTECAVHWANNGGDEYFAQLSKLPYGTLMRVPYDITLMRCHNTVSSNASRRYQSSTADGSTASDRGTTSTASVGPTQAVFALSHWTLAQLVIDYREFVDRFLLRRRHVPYDRRSSLRDTGAANISVDVLLRPLYQRDVVESAAIRSDRAYDAIRALRGPELIRRLWLDVDRTYCQPIGLVV